MRFELRDDVHGLDVYIEQPPVRRFSVEAYGTSKYVIRGYEPPLRDFYETQVALTPKRRLRAGSLSQSFPLRQCSQNPLPYSDHRG